MAAGGQNRRIRGDRGLDEELRDTVGAVQELACACVRELLGPFVAGEALAVLTGGKMLRTRLAARLAGRSAAPGTRADLLHACAAVELVHTASLCHDDVIDGGSMRRHRPTLWRRYGRKGAILLGDLLLCGAFEMIGRTRLAWVRAFSSKLTEVARVEARQDLLALGGELDTEAYLARARGTTGPLFAFAARVTASDEGPPATALERAGYLVGTAYQVADDLLDTIGTDDAAGKTLGTDARRGKPTLAGAGPAGQGRAREQVMRLCGEAERALRDWPCATDALADFVLLDLQPVFRRQIHGLNIRPTVETSDA